MFSLYWLVFLSRWKKRFISIVFDVTGVVAIAIVAIWLRLGEIILPAEFVLAIIILPFVSIPVFIRLGLYRAVVRYISHRFILTVFFAVSLSFLIWATALLMLNIHYPRSALIIAWLMAILYIAISRLIIRWLLLSLEGVNEDSDSIIIFGAGNAGRQLMHGLSGMTHKKVVAFIDDDKSLFNQKIGAIKVYKRDDLSELISRFKVKEILLASPQISTKERKKVFSWLEPFPIKVSTLPSLEEIVDGKISFADIREVSIEDLLGRDVVPAKNSLLASCITNKVVMVTGGGGQLALSFVGKLLNKSQQS